VVGFVYYLCDWKWDWGGLLHVEKDGRMFPLLHRFNQLVVIDKGRPHFVSVVAPYAEPRYAVVGFAR
jgi:Rps23 Pro-64 3,4-dihydroxylase Tpa1-like proline 4-hydroxylase